MATLVKERVSVDVNILERSVTYTVNSVFQVAFKIIGGRGLPADHLINSRKVIEDGLFTWLTEQKLTSLHVEIFSPGADACIERWDFLFDYRAEPDERIVKPPFEEIDSIFTQLDELPEGTEYNFAVTLKPGHTEVPGWSPSGLMKLDATDERPFSSWGYGTISSALVYRGRVRSNVKRNE